ncbi:short-chain dehydrogenase reductase 3b, partial [Lathyrus oleraceus]|uniref:short-chain dehydrogenase reductase 3b n=1 Tax=Pisum sativum TaxID=3888 RepID=UPI0021CEEB7A
LKSKVAHRIINVKTKAWLEGKVAIVTGGASGIGEDAVKTFVENGAFVVIADINDELGHHLATSIGLDKVSYHHCDVRDEKQVEQTVSFTLEKYGTLDIVFSNAGIAGPLSSILEFDLNEFDNTIAVNIRGAAATIKHAARVMVDRKIRGSIICTASVAGSVAGSAGHDYVTSKHGLVGLVRSTCGELGAYGIRVNSVSPYLVATPLVCRALKMEVSEVEANANDCGNLKGVTLKAKHIAEAALFLASDESAYISGHNLVVDGGFSVIDTSFPSIIKN